MRNGSLRLLRDRFGREIVAEAVAAIGCREGAKSRTCVVEALCVCIDAEPEWTGQQLAKAMSRCDLERFYRETRAKVRGTANQIPDAPLVTLLVDMIADYLDGAIPQQRPGQSQQAA